MHPRPCLWPCASNSPPDRLLLRTDSTAHAHDANAVNMHVVHSHVPAKTPPQEDNKVAHHILGFLAPRSARTSDMGAGALTQHAAAMCGRPRLLAALFAVLAGAVYTECCVPAAAPLVFLDLPSPAPFKSDEMSKSKCYVALLPNRAFQSCTEAAGRHCDMNTTCAQTFSPAPSVRPTHTGHSSAHAAGGQGGPRRATSQDCEGRTSASGGPRTSQPGAAGSGQHDSRARGMQQDAIPEEGLGPDQSNSARPGSGGGGGSGLWSGRLGLGSLLRGSASRGPSSGGIMESGHSHSSHEGGLGASLRRSVTRGLSNVMQQLGSWRESLGAGASGKLGTVASGRGRSSLDRGPRSSVDQPRRSVDQPRRSVEQPRGSVELGCAERGSLHIGGCDGGGLQGPGAGGAQVAGDLGLRQGPLPVQQGLEASGAGAALPERRQGRSSCSRLGMHATVAAAMAEVDAEHAPAPSLLLPSPAAQFQLSDLYPPEPATSSPVNLGSAVGLQDNSSQNTTQQTSGTDEQSYLSGLARGPPAASPAQLPARLSSGPGSASGAGNTLDQGPAPHARPRPSSSSSASHLLGAPASVSAPEGYQAQPAAPAQQQQHPGMAGPSVTGSTTGRTAGSTDHPRSGVRAAGSRVAQDPCSEAAETQSLASRPHAAGAQSSNPAAAQQLGGGSGLDRHAYGQQAASADGNPTSSSSANSPTVLGVPGGNSRQGRSGGGVLDSATAQSDLQEVIRLSSQQRVSYGGRTSGLLAPAAGAHAHEGSRTGVLASGLSEAGFGSRGARTDGGGAQGCAQDMGPLPTPFRLQPLSGSPHSGPCGLQQAAYGATQVQHQPQAQPQSQTQPQPQAQAQAQGQAQAWPPTQAPLGSSRAGSGRLLVMPVAAAGSISSAAGRAGSGTGWLPQPGSETSPTSCAPVSDMEDEITPHH